MTILEIKQKAKHGTKYKTKAKQKPEQYKKALNRNTTKQHLTATTYHTPKNIHKILTPSDNKQISEFYLVSRVCPDYNDMEIEAFYKHPEEISSL